MNFQIKLFIPSLLTLLLLAVYLTGCISSEGSDTAIPEGDPQFYGTYTIVGSNLIFAAQSKTYTECSSENTLTTKVRTTTADSMYFNIHGDSLEIGIRNPETLASGSIVQLLTVFSRKGSGSGLDGQWERIGTKYSMDGNLSPEDVKLYDRMVVENNSENANNTFVLDFTNSVMRSYLDTKTAERFLANWNQGYTGPFEDTTSPEKDASIYAITVKVMEKHKVQLKGAITGETVTIKHPDQDGAIYSSSDPSHFEFTFNSIPESCPAEFVPGWYRTFLAANKK